MDRLMEHQQGVIESIKSVDLNFAKDSASREQARSTTHEMPISKVNFTGPISKEAPKSSGPVGDMLSMQRTNFRMLARTIRGIKVNEIKVEWELKDELDNIQEQWKTIVSLHLQIDNILQGSDAKYEEEFSFNEDSFRAIKKALNEKLASTAHLQHATPKLEVPTFNGTYTQWPTFLDLYSESIHNNNLLTNCQKMQHLKGKLTGEPERLVQHLHISAENYVTAWDLLNHRYNNPNLLFTKHLEMILNHPVIQTQTANGIKHLYDISMENLHAIQNLGVDTSSWDPLLVHLISTKLDQRTYTAYKEARKDPRGIPKLKELTDFLERKFTALEPILQNDTMSRQHHHTTSASSYQPKTLFHGTETPPSTYKSYHITRPRVRKGPTVPEHEHRAPVRTWSCPLCQCNHAIFYCPIFQNRKPEERLSIVMQLELCQNCLQQHSLQECQSWRKCRVCQGQHNSMLHDAVAYEAMTSTFHVSSKPRDSTNGTHDKKRTFRCNVVLKNESEHRKPQETIENSILKRNSNKSYENKTSVTQFSDSYKKFMADYEKVGQMNHSQSTNKTTCYLPHHVTAESTTTELPTVTSSASVQTSSRQSLDRTDHLQSAAADCTTKGLSTPETSDHSTSIPHTHVRRTQQHPSNEAEKLQDHETSCVHNTPNFDDLLTTPSLCQSQRVRFQNNHFMRCGSCYVKCIHCIFCPGCIKTMTMTDNGLSNVGQEQTFKVQVVDRRKQFKSSVHYILNTVRHVLAIAIFISTFYTFVHDNAHPKYAQVALVITTVGLIFNNLECTPLDGTTHCVTARDTASFGLPLVISDEKFTNYCI